MAPRTRLLGRPWDRAGLVCDMHWFSFGWMRLRVPRTRASSGFGGVTGALAPASRNFIGLRGLRHRASLLRFTGKPQALCHESTAAYRRAQRVFPCAVGRGRRDVKARHWHATRSEIVRRNRRGWISPAMPTDLAIARARGERYAPSCLRASPVGDRCIGCGLCSPRPQGGLWFVAESSLSADPRVCDLARAPGRRPSHAGQAYASARTQRKDLAEFRTVWMRGRR